MTTVTKPHKIDPKIKKIISRKSKLKRVAGTEKGHIWESPDCWDDDFIIKK